MRSTGLVALGAVALLGGCRLFIDLDGITGDAPSTLPESGPDTAVASDGETPPDVASDTRTVFPDDASDANTSPVSLDGLVLLMHLDEPTWSGPNAVIDSSGKGNHGTTMGSLTSAAGRFGRAASFDSASWIDVNDSASLHFSSQMTAAAWIYVAALSQGTFDNGIPSPGIINKRDAYGVNVAFTMFLSNGDHVWVDINSNSRNASGTTFVISQWYHVAMVFDGSASSARRITIYVNGAPDGAFTADPTISANTSHLLIGNLNDGGDKFDGLIDEVAVWERALSAAEIKLLYEAKAPL